MDIQIMPSVLEVLLPSTTRAITLPWAIYIKASAIDQPGLTYLIRHEYVHAAQWRELGISRFLHRYISEYIKGRIQGLGHRDAYLNISLEREARKGELETR